jgi:hypothetical protein
MLGGGLQVNPPSRCDGKNVLLRSLLRLVCVFVIALCFFEILLSITGVNEPARLVRAGFGPYRFDPELGWFAAPNSTSQPTTTNRTITTYHNSLGIRERELNEIAPDRILFIGDSFTWGYDAEVEERFSNLLQRQLPQYGMVNAGVSGFGTDQQFLLMRRLWDQVMPKVVVLTFCVDNDRDDNSSSLQYRTYYKPYFVRTPEGELQVRGYPLINLQRDGSRRTWIDSFAIARLFVDTYTRVRNRQIVVPDPTEQLFDLIQRTVTARGARLVVGLQRHEPRLEAHLRARQIPYTTFDGAPAYPTAGWHWTPEGNSQVARKYLALFAEIGLLPGAAPPANSLSVPATANHDSRQIVPAVPSVFSPSLWRQAAQALPDELVELGRFVQHWSIAVYDNRSIPRLAVTIAAIVVLAIAMAALWVWWWRGMPAETGPLSGFGKFLSSFGAFFGIAVIPPVMAAALFEAAIVRMHEVTTGLMTALLIDAFGRAVALGLFAPDAPERRLINVSEQTARSLSNHLLWGTRALAALALALSIHKALAAPAVVTVATGALFVLVIGGLLFHILLSRSLDDLAGSFTHARLLPGLAWLVLAMIALGLVSGYPQVATVAARALVTIAAVAGALYLLLELGKALWTERLAIDTPQTRAIAAGYRIDGRWLGFAVMTVCGAMGIALLLTALILFIGAR